MSSRAFFPIKNFMTPDPITIDSKVSLEEALTIMENTGVRQLK